MSNRQVGALADFLRRMAEPGWVAALSDGELLERFRARQEEAAFTALVRRHGPAVLGVCRRILHHPQDAEDAFQATFLLLVHRAVSIRKRQSVGSWLHGVARRVAVRARGDRARRRQIEERAPGRAGGDVANEAAGREVRAVLEEEVRRLPERCRLPFVLCYLEGKTNAEAARQLGCPKGTVLSRLARARELLRARLSRRGLTLPTAGLAGLTAGEGVSPAAVPAPLVTATTRAALALVGGGRAGTGMLPRRVATLTERTVKAMAMTKLKLAALLVLAVGLVGGGAGAVAYRARAADRPVGAPAAAEQGRAAEEPGQPPKPRPPEPGADEARARERRKELEQQREELQARVRELEKHLIDLESRWTKQRGGLELAAAEESVRRLERQQALERERERADMKALEERVRELRLEAKKNPKLTDALAEVRKELDQEDLSWRRAEERRSDQLLKERGALGMIQDRLREVEREHAIDRASTQRQLDAAEERLRQLEGRLLDPDGPPEPRADLERKLDRVLREVTEVRRELERRPPREP
jgi:RNA polymerase sigma factor (sigma-70 family)